MNCHQECELPAVISMRGLVACSTACFLKYLVENREHRMCLLLSVEEMRSVPDIFHCQRQV